jgi:hypothetical protein
MLVCPPWLYWIHSVPENGVPSTVVAGRLQVNETLVVLRYGKEEMLGVENLEGCAELFEQPMPVIVGAVVPNCSIVTDIRPLLASTGAPQR